MTNQALVGKTRTELIGQTFIEVSFTDYLGQPLQGIRSIIEVATTGNEYRVTPEAGIHPFATLNTGGNMNANWVIEENRLRVYGGSTTGIQVVTEVFKFLFQSLQTAEKEYTKFKFIK